MPFLLVFYHKTNMKFTNFGTWFLKKHLLVQKRLQCWYDEYYHLLTTGAKDTFIEIINSL